jgi:hypothetical protein
VVVLQDVRGRWASEGEFYPYRSEFEDGYDTVEWVAGLPGVDGSVGAYGLSYMGATAWHAAAARPPSLRAIAPAMAPNDQHLNLAWRGGAFLWGTHVLWSLQAIGMPALLRKGLHPDDFLSAFLGLVDGLDAFEESVRHLPPRALPSARPEDAFVPSFFEEMRHPARGDHHRARSTTGRHGRIGVPALIVAGWHDLMLGADLEHAAAMRSDASGEARERSRLVVGPWSHGAFLNVVGERDFGLRASGATLDLREDLTGLFLRWFDQRLGRRQTGIDDEAPVKLFVQGLDRWRDEDAWPLERARATRWHLRAGGGLDHEPPEPDEAPDAYVYDPLDPCPTTGGTLLLPRTYPAGPVEQSAVLGRRDVLVYTSGPLAADLELTGPVTAVLHAATSAPDTDWVVKLCEVRPDGRTYNVCDGILRARYRRSAEEPSLVPREEVQRYEIDLWATSIVLRAGQRLRVVVTSSDFPRYDRNPNTGEFGVDAVSTMPALQRVFHDAARPSYLVLPVIP